MSNIGAGERRRKALTTVDRAQYTDSRETQQALEAANIQRPRKTFACFRARGTV